MRTRRLSTKICRFRWSKRCQWSSEALALQRWARGKEHRKLWSSRRELMSWSVRWGLSCTVSGMLGLLPASGLYKRVDISINRRRIEEWLALSSNERKLTTPCKDHETPASASSRGFRLWITRTVLSPTSKRPSHIVCSLSASPQQRRSQTACQPRPHTLRSPCIFLNPSKRRQKSPCLGQPEGRDRGKPCWRTCM